MTASQTSLPEPGNSTQAGTVNGRRASVSTSPGESGSTKYRTSHDTTSAVASGNSVRAGTNGNGRRYSVSTLESEFWESLSPFAQACLRQIAWPIYEEGCSLTEVASSLEISEVLAMRYLKRLDDELGGRE